MAKHRSGPGEGGPPARGEGGGTILDVLTGVYSIEYFEHQMRSQIAYALRHDRPLSVIIFTIDYLDDVAGTFGREARDRVLVQVADVVRAHVRDEDVVARYGRSQFALLCRDTPLAAAGFLAKRLRQAVESTGTRHAGMELPVTISLGVASLDAELDEEAPMVQRAEGAMAKARVSGNTIVVSEA